MKRLTLKGHGAAKGVAEGEALVTEDMLCFISDVDIMTGTINIPTSKFRGQSVAGKILVFPGGRGSTGGPYGLYMLSRAGRIPKAIVNVIADPIIVTGAVISHIPMVYQLDQNPIEVIETGDHVRVDGNQGIVVVTKKG